MGKVARPAAPPLVRLVGHKGQTLIELGVFTGEPRAFPTTRGVVIHPDRLGDLIDGMVAAQADLARSRCHG